MCRNKEPNPFDLLEQELEEERQLEMDLWYLDDEDHIYEYWSGCPSHIKREYIEDYESRYILFELEESNVQTIDPYSGGDTDGVHGTPGSST